METSFQRLRVKQMDLLQVHNLVDVATHAKDTPGDDNLPARFAIIGITHYTLVRIRRCRARAEGKSVGLPCRSTTTLGERIRKKEFFRWRKSAELP
jgi:hypothetical protein